MHRRRSAIPLGWSQWEGRTWAAGQAGSDSPVQTHSRLCNSQLLSCLMLSCQMLSCLMLLQHQLARLPPTVKPFWSANSTNKHTCSAGAANHWARRYADDCLQRCKDRRNGHHNMGAAGQITCWVLLVSGLLLGSSAACSRPSDCCCFAPAARLPCCLPPPALLLAARSCSLQPLPACVAAAKAGTPAGLTCTRTKLPRL